MPHALAPDDRLTILYRAQGGYARTDATLDVDEAGGEQMFLGSTMSLPTAGELDRVGSFEGRMETALRKRLRALVGRLPDDLPAGAPAVPDSVVRNLRVTVNDQSTDFIIPGTAPPPLDEIERLLQKAMTSLLRQPAEAVGLTLEVDKDGSPALVLSNVGSRPVTLRFSRDDGTVTTRGTVVLMSPQGVTYASESLSPEVVNNAIASVSTQSGRVTLEAAMSMRFPFTAPEMLPSKGRIVLTGGVELDVDIGGRPRRISIQAREVPFRR